MSCQEIIYRDKEHLETWHKMGAKRWEKAKREKMDYLKLIKPYIFLHPMPAPIKDHLGGVTWAEARPKSIILNTCHEKGIVLDVGDTTEELE